MAQQSISKALSREDLVYILNSVFKISPDADNAISFIDGKGLYAKKYDTDLSNHTDNENIHIDERVKKILEDITIDPDTDDIYYRGILLSRLSAEPNNAIKQKPDGLFVNDFEKETKDHIGDDSIHVNASYTQAIDEHLINSDIHVTAQDKQNWDEHKDNAPIHMIPADKVKWDEHVDNNDIHVTVADKENWDGTYEKARQHAVNLFNNLILHDFLVVTALPTEHISFRTVYFLMQDADNPAIEDGVYIWNEDRWLHLSFPKEIFLAFKKAVEDRLDALEQDIHTHENSEILQKFTEDEDGHLLYNGDDIRQLFISDVPKNALKMIDGKLYVPDYLELIHSLQVAPTFAKENLYNGDCDKPGSYELKGHIDDFSMLLVEYYYKNDEGVVGNAKSVMLDVDTMNDLYTQGIDYMLELGYGISVANSKIRMHDDQLIVNYYHNVCIYKVTGIRKGDSNG